MSSTLKKLHKFVFLALFSFTLAGAAGDSNSQAPYYDEIFDEQGAVRPVYKDVYSEYSKLSPKQKEELGKMTYKDFGGDNALDALPRIFTESEFNTLKKGVEQRGTAIQKFLQDYYAGNWEVVHKIVPKRVLERIVGRSNELGYKGLLLPEHVAFPYGPDIIRDAKGQWRVVEDNPGFIGGPGDLIHARETLLDRMPTYKNLLKPIDDPLGYYGFLISQYREQSIPRHGKIVLFSIPPFVDHEDDRLIDIYRELGVESVVAGKGDKKLVVTQDGVFLQKVGKGGNQDREPMGYIVFNGEHHEIDFSHPAAYERAVVNEAQGLLDEPELTQGQRQKLLNALKPDPKTHKMDLKALLKAIDDSDFESDLVANRRMQVKGLVNAMLTGKVGTNYTPGVDFIGDKEFYVYVDDIVRHYSGQEPIIKNIPTERFGFVRPNGAVELNRELVDRVFADPKKYVIKAVDGRGGNAVWVGAAIPEEEFQMVRARLTAEPERYISQDFMHLSVMDGKIVDTRMISAVTKKGVFVFPTPWGRALPIGGDGKVNLSSSGRELAVIVVKDPPKTTVVFTPAVAKDCSSIFGPLHPPAP